jgi:VCBS repeat protein
VTPAVSVLPGLGSGGVGDGTFGPFTTFPINDLSTGLATGDFDLDGNPDLVATEYTDGTVGVLLGTGTPVIGAGSFSSAAHYNAGPVPYRIEVADFNEDGSQDLAVANSAGGGIWVLRGLPNGTFAYQTSLNAGNCSAAAPADLNDDGILDIVSGTVTGSNSGIAEVFLGQGAGGVGNATFGPVTTYTSGGDVFHVIVGDLDQDGRQDALMSQGNGNYVSLLPGICAEAPPDPRKPVLTDVRDVPNDNGGRVFLTWTASSLDVPGGAVNSYRVWRRIPPALVTDGTRARLATREVIAIARAESPLDIVYWEALVTLPAQRLLGYGYTAATTQDSMRTSNPYAAFFVSALTSNIDVFYSSEVDSGYSVDNLRPGNPHGLAGTLIASGFSMQWEPNEEPDLAGYRLYRGENADFVPSDATLIASPSEAAWVDPDGSGQEFYKLSAVDVHANESDFALLAPTAVSVEPGGAALTLALHGARPNPSLDGRLSLSFVLGREGTARLDLVDLAGRRILSRDLSHLGGGPHVLEMAGAERVAPGIYFARLSQGPQTLESKVVVAR